MLIGIPLYAVTLGQFAGMTVDHALEERREKLLERPIDAADFKYACTLLSSEASTTVNMGTVS